MKLLFATITATAVTSLALIQPAEARCFWNGFDMECHYPAPPPTVYREVYRDVEPVYRPPRIIGREIIEQDFDGPPVIYYDDWR